LGFNENAVKKEGLVVGIVLKSRGSEVFYVRLFMA
jgi:hypothetical protein